MRQTLRSAHLYSMHSGFTRDTISLIIHKSCDMLSVSISTLTLSAHGSGPSGISPSAAPAAPATHVQLVPNTVWAGDPGHSLGGALATLAAIDIQTASKCRDQMDISCYTFGAPRTGNHAFAWDFNEKVGRSVLDRPQLSSTPPHPNLPGTVTAVNLMPILAMRLSEAASPRHGDCCQSHGNPCHGVE